MDCHEGLINHLPENSISGIDPIKIRRLLEDEADVIFQKPQPAISLYLSNVCIIGKYQPQRSHVHHSNCVKSKRAL